MKKIEDSECKNFEEEKITKTKFDIFEKKKTSLKGFYKQNLLVKINSQNNKIYVNCIVLSAGIFFTNCFHKKSPSFFKYVKFQFFGENSKYLADKR